MVLLTMSLTRNLLSPLRGLLLATLLLAACFLAACASTGPSCERLSYDNPDGLTIILVQDGFTEEKFRQLAWSVRDTILEKEPFASKPRLNFYLLNNSDTSICVAGDPLPVIGEPGADPLAPLVCDIPRVRELASQCGVARGKLLILTNESVTSQTSITHHESGVMFLDMKNQPPEIIQHELAHFFGLVDERSLLHSHALGPGREPAPNCRPTLAEAEALWRPYYPANHSFPQGCAGHPDWYKPEQPTLLSEFPDPSWEYGEFNRRYLASVLECCYAPEQLEGCDDFFAAYPSWSGCRRK